jgi:ribonucleoside-diphosphate reductase alpha chain
LGNGKEDMMTEPVNMPSFIGKDGNPKAWTSAKIQAAIEAAWADANKGRAIDDDVSYRICGIVASIAAKVQKMGMAAVPREVVHTVVELELMRADPPTARAYLVYRALRQQANESPPSVKALVSESGAQLDSKTLLAIVEVHAQGLDVDCVAIAKDAAQSCFNGMPDAKITDVLVLTARTYIERQPDASKLAARLVIDAVERTMPGDNEAQKFLLGIQCGVKARLLDQRLLEFDLPRLAAALKPQRNQQFDYLGIQTLVDRYLIKDCGRIIETPQGMLMRVAMGISLNELNRNEKAIQFYDLFSQFYGLSSTPTLFNSGTARPQLSSCFISTVGDSITGIYGAIAENAQLQKWAGGMGNDWTPVRALGARIKGTNGESQGVIPFLNVVNATAVAVNQGGKRKGAVCAYLETWHLDIEEFLELRKNTGDERRRTHDMNTANWIPDLFMKRVRDGANWTLFSPNDVPELHDLFGDAFERAYVEREFQAQSGKLAFHKVVAANDLWKKMLSMLFETGHPWMTFKDPCNIRNPQQHVGVVHSSNLCTEITLNTSDEEIAVCNLASINLAAHVVRGDDGEVYMNVKQLAQTAALMLRMLDNVIDINFYAVDKARNANLKHRPVGLGVMGWHEALQRLGIAYGSEQSIALADQWLEVIAYHAYDSSSDLAIERGRYSSFAGSLWSKGILPPHSWATLMHHRGVSAPAYGGNLDWEALAGKIKSQGMRNSNCLAIAPTATIANIAGVSSGIDPVYQNLCVKSNLSGEFTVVNPALYEELKRRNLWTPRVAALIKGADGSVASIADIPADMKAVFATAFEIDPSFLIQAAAKRQIWIDQAQSLNLYLENPSGKKLSAMYFMCWELGLKTTYYLRSRSKSAAEKSTDYQSTLNAVTVVQAKGVEAPKVAGQSPQTMDGPACFLRPGDAGFEECEACQ